jgi:hypothetical protein
MKVTGYDLRNALTRLNNRKGLLLNQWNNALFAFEGEETDPIAISNKIDTIEQRIVNVQLAQSEYNASVMAEVNNAGEITEVTLDKAIKQVGPIKRMSSMWKKYAQDGDLDFMGRHRARARVRATENEEAKRVVLAEVCMVRHEKYQDMELALSNAIAKANATTVDVPGLSSSDLEVEV